MYLFIHRKDLRTHDMRAFDALKRRGLSGLHLLILDPALLKDGRAQAHSGRQFLREVARLQAAYGRADKRLHLLHGNPVEVVETLLTHAPLQGIVAHADYTPYARRRDEQIRVLAEQQGVPWVLLDDLPLADLEDFHRHTGRSEPYKVFTPFYNKWSGYMQQYAQPQASAKLEELQTVAELPDGIGSRFALPPELEEALWGAHGNAEDAGNSHLKVGEGEDPWALAANEGEDPWAQAVDEGEDAWAQAVYEREDPCALLADFVDSEGLRDYDKRRDRYTRDDGTSGISRYLNTGSLSARTAYAAAQGKDGGETWVRQLAWRDFYLYQAIYNEDFYRYEQRYDLSPLSDQHYEAWEQARTGIPIIDASMTELRETGEMHNRLRMINAMFLTKNLLCPFTLGERYFRRQLADYDNCLNRGGWLWSSSLGYDAAPYFRIMNPASQSHQHDPSGTYIRRWLPQLAHLDDKAIHLPQPDAIVDLKASRARAIEVYKEILRA
ncbi:deoxyribodipyrimidine photolyase [Paenibacillus sp. 598K]|uniref:cryptochrome/photolyase family protein n=1 Tax=Paenibacillus sp. 598K TaxID=1117987 RepID=UPI000FFAC015|nr:deoxyribodipyrimidine photo-lyase [Paenibacillus sp. 598K]GBF77845.1 deoxyribodipyrimidine photolyase [Paenibacillus sp. 598K]